VETCLEEAGCHITKVNRGAAAVNQARHETLDAAVLISTGPEMDLAEIALNLRDINPSIAIIFISGHHSRDEEADPTDAIAHAIPRAKVLAKGELGHYLDSPEWKSHPGLKPMG
jgi:DNA-binding response OmpR family regulator